MRRYAPRVSLEQERAEREELMRRWREERAARRVQVAREASGEATGFRYAVECGGLWVGPHTQPGPHVSDDCCTHREPVLYTGDRASAQARAQVHAERNSRGGATHHSPMIVPESEIPRRLAVHRLR